MPAGLPTEALITQIIVAKFGDYLPFCRQPEIYSAARASSSIGRRSPTARDAPAFILSRSPIICPIVWPRRTASSWTKQPLRFSILDEEERRSASSGRSRRMIAGMAGRGRRLCSSDTRQGAAALTPNDSCAATGDAICNATAMTDMSFSRG